ncbi:hypothetical protein Tco_0286543 [Tanacetum coccineum]
MRKIREVTGSRFEKSSYMKERLKRKSLKQQQYENFTAIRKSDNKNKKSQEESVAIDTSTSLTVVSCEGLCVVMNGAIRQRKGLIMQLWHSHLQVLTSEGNPQMDLQDQGVIDSGCSRHMKENMSYLTDYEEIDGGYLKFDLFSVSQMCDKKNSVLFNDTECIVLSPNFKLIDESQVLLRVPRKNNLYSVDLKNIVPKGGLTGLFAKATSDESKLWHRRLS